jgi:hypothetical protein
MSVEQIFSANLNKFLYKRSHNHASAWHTTMDLRMGAIGNTTNMKRDHFNLEWFSLGQQRISVRVLVEMPEFLFKSEGHFSLLSTLQMEARCCKGEVNSYPMRLGLVEL